MLQRVMYVNIYSYFLSELEDRDIAGRLSGNCKTFFVLLSKSCRLNMMSRQLAIKWIQSAKLSGSESDHTWLIPRLSMSGAIPPLHLRLSLAERNNFTFRKIFRLLVLITRKWQACYIIIIRQALGLKRPFK